MPTETMATTGSHPSIREAALPLLVLHQALLVTLAVLALGFALVVAARMVSCSVQALRARRFALAAWPIAGVLGLAASFGGLVLVWLAYGISHSEKTLWTDLRMSALSFLPFYGVCHGLWRMGRAIRARLARPAA